MSRHAGVVRNASGLAMATGALGALSRSMSADVAASRDSWEATNLLTIASAVVSAALARTESRGCHRRADHPDTDPALGAPPRGRARRSRRDRRPPGTMIVRA